MTKAINSTRIDRLRLLLSERFSDSQISFANIVQVNPGQVSHWLTGFRNLGEKSARKIEEKLNLPYGWLDQNPETKLVQKNVLPGMVPLLAWENISAYSESNFSESTYCPTVFGAHTFAVNVLGDAMATDQGYFDGDVIFVDPSKKIKHGDDVVFKTSDNKFLFRRLKIDEISPYLWAINPDFTPKMIRIENLRQIIGKVIYSGRAR
jgi:SOS-response transcriptional repressor LexA